MTFGESCLPPLEKERKKEIKRHSLLPSNAHTLEWQDGGLSH